MSSDLGWLAIFMLALGVIFLTYWLLVPVVIVAACLAIADTLP